jgi:non-lysosomal glucosylceramidase
MNCSDSSCGCSSAPRQPGFNRRDFLKLAGLGVGLLSSDPWQAMAGPFAREDFDRLVPSDKKLQPQWVKSLTDRGEPTVYRGADLEKIGMPIGGICAGQLYFGGDGKLWHWDIFNQHVATGAEHYAKPMAPAAPLEQGFGIKLLTGANREFYPLDRAHWRDISFNGEYPIAAINYRDPGLPVSVRLEAFSPFIPLNTDDSSLPATIFDFTVRNEGAVRVELEFTGWLQNAVCLHSSQRRAGLRHNRPARAKGLLCIESSASEPPASRENAPRLDIVFDDFEDPAYTGWTVEGTAFGSGPAEISRVPGYQGDVGGHGRRVVNSHASAPGESVEQKDQATGMLTSRPFTLTRDYISFLIGGGAHASRTCLNLLVNGQVVLSATGRNDNHMSPLSWDVRRWTGKTGVLQVVDHESGGWGNIGVDHIVFSDTPRTSTGPLAEEADFGTMTLGLLAPRRTDRVNSSASGPEDPATNSAPATKGFDEKLISSLTRRMVLAPGASAQATFLVSWHMPNLQMNRLPGGRHYATRFASARAVAEYVAAQAQRLSAQTRLWHDTWYDSSLPYWLLDRTFLNTSILASSTAYRFGDGRFYGWEGVGCCEGTCGHVWQYAHAVARLFPDLERMTRESVDFGLALQPDGAIHFRGEFNDIPAIDAQAGTVLRALREHQMSPDDAWLRRNWPKIKHATEWLIRKDEDGDGLIRGNQHNTLDTDWFGPVAWLSGLYLAALLAAQTMAEENGDARFAGQCRDIFRRGQENLSKQLFNGEYFINQPDRAHLDAINSGTGCEIDQVFGQSWAFQVGLPRVLPERETLSALRALWRYNFTPDVGPYRERYKPGRWYAMPGEAGLLMCTFPRTGWDYVQAKGKGPDWAAGYFNECMNGFEYQVAGHMLWEGLVTEGLAVTRAIHDRYHASRRNPWNEIECGDHYARSMASYGVFLAACGFECHGPQGRLGFAPRVLPTSPTLGPLSFKCAFTAPEGWGSFSQTSTSENLECRLAIKYGSAKVRTMALQPAEGLQVRRAEVRGPHGTVGHQLRQSGRRVEITLAAELSLKPGQILEIRLT